MTNPQSRFDLTVATAEVGSLADSVVVLLDAQDAYLTGPVTLPDARRALAQMALLLERARAAGTPIIHVVHEGKPGGPFDPNRPSSRISEAVRPMDGEAVVTKKLANAFTSEEFRVALARSGRKRIVLAGFTTHMSVSATARSGLDNNVSVTVVADGCATRDLPSPYGGMVPAAAIHEAGLASLADRFAAVVPQARDIPD